MLIKSQPLDPKAYKKLGLDDIGQHKEYSEKKIQSQYIGKISDNLLDRSEKRRFGFKRRLGLKWREIKDTWHDTKHTVRNHFKWRKTMRSIRPWEGFDGLICVMQTHLCEYIATEEKYGHSLDKYKNHKIATAKETVELLERMKDPDAYLGRRREKVKIKYPKYKSLITKYENGGISSSGDFVAQGNGWVGIDAGKDPRKGYFEFVDGKFELVNSPHQIETDRLLTEITKYHEEISNTYIEAENDSDNDFEMLCQLLKENLYSWWD